MTIDAAPRSSRPRATGGLAWSWPSAALGAVYGLPGAVVAAVHVRPGARAGGWGVARGDRGVSGDASRASVRIGARGADRASDVLRRHPGPGSDPRGRRDRGAWRPGRVVGGPLA